MIETILYIILNVIIFVLFYAYINLYIKFRMISNLLMQEKVDKEHFKLKLTEHISKSSNKKLEQTEGFVNFISQSRDWAFKYIEDVQGSLVSLKETVSILRSTPIKAVDRKKAIRIIEDALKHLPEDKP